jgi:hypothetical protein
MAAMAAPSAMVETVVTAAMAAMAATEMVVTEAMAEMAVTAEMVAMEATVLKRSMIWLAVASGLPLVVFGQGTARLAPVPADKLELVTGPVHQAVTQDDRNATLQLLGRAHDNFSLRSAHTAYHLKVAFTATSLGQTNYDGDWEMEDVYVPGKGTRWSAKSAAGYQTTRIDSHGKNYAEGTAAAIPLRLHEARGLLMDPLPAPAYAGRGSVRTASATFRGAAVTCLLLSQNRKPAYPATGRGWDESEECIDPNTGLLQTHSDAPGRYVVYEYAKTPQLDGRTVPQTVTVTEAGNVVSTITVESLTAIAAPDASQFGASDSMKTGGEAVTMGGAAKLSRIHSPTGTASAGTVTPVCVLGLLTPAGQLVEAHSLQPSDPNSAAAVADAKTIDFSPTIPAGAAPQQHLVVVVEKFVSAQ